MSFNVLWPPECNTLLNPDIVIYIPINQKRNRGFSTGLMSLLMLRTSGAVHQSVISPFMVYAIWPFEQPWSPPQPAARSPLSPSFSHLFHSLPSIMFPCFGLDGETPNPQQLNPFPCPASFIYHPKWPWHPWNCLCFRVFILLSCVCNYWNADGGVGGSAASIASCSSKNLLVHFLSGTLILHLFHLWADKMWK